MSLAALILVLAGCDGTKEELEGMIESLTERVAAIENTQLKALEEQVTSIQKELTTLQNADNVKVQDISALEDKMTAASDDLAQLKESVASIKGTPEELSGRISEINAKLSELDTQINAILSSIAELKDKVDAASVMLSYIPDYYDKEARVQYTRTGLKITGTVTLNFNVQPSSAANTIANYCMKHWKSAISAFAVYTHTKAAGGERVALTVSGISAKNGIFSVTVTVDNLGKDFILGNIGASLAIEISCGDIQFVTDYVTLSPVMKDKLIKYLLNNFDTDGDGQVNENDMNKVTSLDVSSREFGTIDDILSQMPALETLDCSDNYLRSLDLSKNPNLTTLDCSDNNLSSLDLSKNPNLTTLDCSDNDLRSLDLSKNESLTSANLQKNSYLTKVVCKSLDWVLNCCMYCRHNVLFCQPDGNQISFDNLSVEINGKTWKQFNLGATPGYIYGGDRYTFDEAQSACPTGWRAPTNAELKSLCANYSNWTTYLGVKGRWFSGSNTYSSTAPAIFLPVFYPSSSKGGYWSSTEKTSDSAYLLDFNSEYVSIAYYIDYRSHELSVRCLKD